MTAVATEVELKEMPKLSPSRRPEEPPTAARGWIARCYLHRRRGATVAAGVLAIGLAYHVVLGQNGILAYEQKRHDARVLHDQLTRLQDENRHLQSHVDRLQDDPGAIEHQAREELHYTRPGEVIVTLPNEAAAAGVKEDPK